MYGEICELLNLVSIISVPAITTPAPEKVKVDVPSMGENGHIGQKLF